jgi:hypothetical protein
VLHDALAKGYGPENISSATGRVLNLSTITHRLGGVHMVANVSRALQSFVAVGSSVVRPGELGCTSNFLEYRHRLDPITKIRQFNPTDNDGWVPHDVFKSAYQLIEPTSVSAANARTRHYLLTPWCICRSFVCFSVLGRTRRNKATASRLCGKPCKARRKPSKLPSRTCTQRQRAPTDAAQDRRRTQGMVLGFGEHLMRAVIRIIVLGLCASASAWAADAPPSASSKAPETLCKQTKLTDAKYIPSAREAALTVRHVLCFEGGNQDAILNALVDFVEQQRSEHWFDRFGGFENNGDPLARVLEILNANRAQVPTSG